MGGIARRSAVVVGIACAVSAPAWATTTEVEAHGQDWAFACARWDDEVPREVGDRYTEQQLCAASNRERVASLSVPTRDTDVAWYTRSSCTWSEYEWVHPETGETFRFEGGDCEVVEDRYAPVPPGTLTVDGDTYRVQGDHIAGCAADFSVTVSDFFVDDPSSDDDASPFPVWMYGRYEGEYAMHSDVVGSACDIALGGPGTWGDAGSSSSSRGFAVEVP